MNWDGDEYQARFDALARAGTDVHGEASFVEAFAPTDVLDAGCGTGRVGIELDRRGIEVVGIDADASMLATARQRAPQVSWVHDDLTCVDLQRRFDVVVMAGNVPLFTPHDTVGRLVAACARHVRAGGRLVAGFQTDRHVSLDRYDTAATAAGLELDARWSTWQAAPFVAGGDYAVTVHRRPPGHPRAVLHLTTRAAWDTAHNLGHLTPEGFADEGFVHCSDLHQLPRVARLRFAGMENLVALVVSVDALGEDAPLVDEPGDPGRTERFPHVYAPLPVDAVLEALDVPPPPPADTSDVAAAVRWEVDLFEAMADMVGRTTVDLTGSDPSAG
ncbi:MAG: DUF952 domain-containing protein [Acidimicrobiia bacterium]|nr:DUF952 domain-containing protein [Acidimicrobiia bacterium]